MKEKKAIMHSTSGSPCLTSRLTGSIRVPVISMFKLLFTVPLYLLKKILIV